MSYRTQSNHSGMTKYLVLGIAFSLLLILCNFLFNMALVYQYSKKQALKPADAALVLGAAAWDKRPSPVFRERINHAIALYQSHMVSKIIFTGGTPKSGFMTEAAVGRRYALKQGVDVDDIYYENQSRDTYQNLVNGYELGMSNNINTYIIVSDPFHLARAAYMAHDLNMDAQTSPTSTTRYTTTRAKLIFLFQESYSLMMYRFIHTFQHMVMKS